MSDRRPERIRRAYLRERRAIRTRVVETAGREALVLVACTAAVIGALTYLANHVLSVSFLVVPPLVAATYRLFTTDLARGVVPWGFPFGLTGGAVSGWLSIALVEWVGASATLGPYQLTAVTAVTTVGLSGAALWALDVDLPPALAVGLLLPFAGISPPAYTVNVVVASLLVTAGYTAWQVARDSTYSSTLLPF